MNEYEISMKLADNGFSGENSNETLSIMRLMRACEVFGIEFSFEKALTGKLYGHIGTFHREGEEEVGFILLDMEDMAFNRKNGVEGSIRYWYGNQVHIE